MIDLGDADSNTSAGRTVCAGDHVVTGALSDGIAGAGFSRREPGLLPDGQRL